MQIDTIPILQLLGNLQKVAIHTQDDVSVAISCDGSDIADHVYSPDSNGLIEIDLKDIIRPLLSLTLSDSGEPYQQTQIVRQFTLTATPITQHPTPVTRTFSVIRAGVDRLSDSATNFLTQNFLTWQPQVKQVTYYTPEFLTYYALSAATIRCEVHFDDNTVQSLTLCTIPAGQCWTIPVQYALIVGKCSGKLPLWYDVWAEAASRLTYKQRYVASDMLSEEEQWILFENSLGGIDTFRAYGDSENTAEHTHNIARIDDDQEEYRVDTERKFNKSTGYLGRTERLWLLDFFPSLGKYIYTGTYLRRIIVTDSNVVHNQKELPSAYTFTYQYADARPLLNLPRAELPSEPLHINLPDIGSFTLAPRLAEVARLPLSDGALFPVQNPYSEQWTTTTAVALREYLLGAIEESGIISGLPDALQFVDGYLLVYGDKIKAAWADVAGDIADGSPVYDRFLRKDVDDVAHGVITFEKEPWAMLGQIWGRNNFLSGPFGRGARIDSDGNAEVESLYSRSFISTPEFRFQQITVTDGENWCANGRGEIAAVYPGLEYDAAGNERVTAESSDCGIIELHLDTDEYASVRVGGICKGMYNALKQGMQDPRFVRSNANPDDPQYYSYTGGDGSTRYDDTALYQDSSQHEPYLKGKDGIVYTWDDELGTYIDDEGDAIEAENMPDTNEGTSEQGIFRAKYGFFSSYFYVKRIVKNEPGKCIFEYGLRNSNTPHPCPFMKFVQYGHFWDERYQSFSYETSIGPYVKIVCQGVRTWNPMVQNITHIWGWLGGMKVKLRGDEEQYRSFPPGNGLFVQDNIYFGGVVQNLSVETVNDLKDRLGQYVIELSEHVDVITVDDAGNAIGGLWTDETYTDADDNEQTLRTYRITCAITVKKNDEILTLAPSTGTPGTGQYRLYATLHGCTINEQLLQQSSMLCITGIENIKDGVAGSADDNNFDYDAMRQMSSCSVDIIAVCEGDGYSIAKNVPIAIKHDSQPFIGADMENEHSGISWNEKTSAFIGLPVDIPLRMWKNDQDLKITGLSIKVGSTTRQYTRALSLLQETTFNPPSLQAGTDLFPYGLYISTTDEVVNGVKRPILHVSTADSSLPNQTDISVTISAVYAGISYERTLVHTITRTNDLSVYRLDFTPNSVHRQKNVSDWSQQISVCILGESSDDGKYIVDATQRTAKLLSVRYCVNGDTTNWQTLSFSGNTATVTVGQTATQITFQLLQDGQLYLGEEETIPVTEDGDDGTDIEFVFYAPATGDNFTPDTTTGFPQIDESGTYGGKTKSDDEFLPKVVGTNIRWTDDPTGVAANKPVEYYAKREKKDGVWGSFGDVHVWSHYAQDGDPALVFDLTNENSFIQALQDGTVVGSYESTACMIYEAGQNVTSNFTFTIDSTQHITATIQNGTVTVSNMEQKDSQTDAVIDQAVVTIKATGNANTQYAGKELLANYYIRKTYVTAVYRLSLSNSAIPCANDGSPKSGQLMFSVVRSERDQQQVLSSMAAITAAGLYIYYGTSSASTLLTNDNIKNFTALIGTSDSKLIVELYEGAKTSGHLWDSETLYKTLDGAAGISVTGQGIFRSTVFTRTFDNISQAQPTGGSYANRGIPDSTTFGGKTYTWSDGIPTGDGHVWSTTRIFTSDGASPQESAWSNPVKVTDVPDVYDVEFSAASLLAIPSDPDTAPAIWYDPSTGENRSGTLHIGDTGAPSDWTAMNWRAERVKVDGTWGDWIITQIKGEKGEQGDNGDSWFKSQVFIRTNDTPSTPTGGDFSHPWPSGKRKEDYPNDSSVLWYDGVPAGTAKLWRSVRSFCSDSNKSDSVWSTPQPDTDTSTLDIEFSPSTNKPAVSTLRTVVGGAHPSTGVWYDPSNLPAGEQMIWRAERKISNGVFDGDWVISRIYGEQGDAAITYTITANRSTVFDCDADGKIIGSGAITLQAWKRTGNGDPELFSCFFKRTSNGTPTMETSANSSVSYVLSTSVAYTSFLVEIYAQATDTTPLAQLSLVFSKQGATGQSITGPVGPRGLIIRITEWETGKQYRNDEAVTAPGTDRYLDIVTISKDKDGNFWSQATQLDAFAFQCLQTHTSSAALRPLDSNDQAINATYWQPFSSTGPITTPLLWAARAMIEYLSVNEITIMDGQTVKGGVGNGAFPLWFGNQYSGYSFVLTNDGKAYFGSYETYVDSEENIHTAGQRIVIDPTAKTIRIYDSNGVLVTELSGTKYHSVSGAETSIYTGESAGSAIFTLPTQEELLDGEIHELLQLTDVNLITHPSLEAGRTVAIELSGLLQLDHCAVRIGVATTDAVPTYYWHRMVGNVSTTFNVVLKNLGPLKLPAGHDYVLVIQVGNSVAASTLTLWSGRASWKADEYKAHYFGNGFTVGSNSENHFSVYNANVGDEHHQRMNVVVMNDVGGFAMDADGNSDYIFGHRVPRPTVLCAGYVDTNGNFGGRSWNGNTDHDVFASSTGQTASQITKNGVLYRLPLANLRHDAAGNYLPVDPGFNSAWMVTVQAVGTYDSNPDSHPVACIEYITSTELCIRTKRGGNDAVYAFWIKIEYMVHPGY